MKESIHFGRIAGVRVGANWSLLAIFFLIACALSTSELPSVVPHQSTVLYWLAGTAVAAVFFVSLLAHELCHAVVARRAGIEVEGIVLWLFGGVSRLTREPQSPRVELEVAVVGPLASLGLAASFFGVSCLAWTLGGGRLLGASLAWLALINGLLGAFNLVPAFPLDGGRILRALIWWRRGDKPRATAAAADAGRAFGWLLMAVGVLAFLYGDWLDGLWMGFLGWFLLGAASAEANVAELARRLAGIRVQDVMSPVSVGQVVPPADETVTCHPDEQLGEVVGRMAPAQDRPVLVVDDRSVVGLLWPRDVRWATSHPELVRRTGPGRGSRKC